MSAPGASSRPLVITIVVLAIVSVAAIILAVVAFGQSAAPEGARGPENMLSDGAVFVRDGGDIAVHETEARAIRESPVPTDASELPALVHLEVYVDYMGPICGAFDVTHRDTLSLWVEDGLANVEVHPVAILDRVSQGTEYSTRAANAFACAVELSPATAWQVNEALFDAQPAENSPGLTDDQLVDVLAAAGADSDEVAACVRDQRFADWVTDATDRVSANGVTVTGGSSDFQGTPTIIVNGTVYPLTREGLEDPGYLAAFVNELVN